MNLAPVIARIATQCPGFLLVGGAADFSGVDGTPRATPAAFVVPLAERARPSEGFGEDFQIVDATFGILLAVTNVASRGGAEGVTDLEALRAEVRAALLGWIPAGGGAPLAFERGDLLEFRPGLLWWQDAWRGACSIESAT